MQTIWKKTIFGESAGRGGDIQRVRHPVTGQPMRVHTGAATRFRENVRRQVGVLADQMEGELRLTARIYNRDNRARMDASALVDMLQGRIIKSARQIREMHIYHGVDRGVPRAELCVEKIGMAQARGRA